MPLGNIRRNRDNHPAHLIAQSKDLRLRKRPLNRIDLINKIHRLLPDNQLLPYSTTYSLQPTPYQLLPTTYSPITPSTNLPIAAFVSQNLTPSTPLPSSKASPDPPRRPPSTSSQTPPDPTPAAPSHSAPHLGSAALNPSTYSTQCRFRYLARKKFSPPFNAAWNANGERS